VKPGEINKHAIFETMKTIFGEHSVVCEYRYHPTRRWRFDYAVPAIKFAVEYHGHSGFVGKGASGHSTIKGLTNDCEKMNRAHALGWRVLAFTALHFRDTERKKHDLLPVRETIMNTLAGMQLENETAF